MLVRMTLASTVYHPLSAINLRSEEQSPVPFQSLPPEKEWP